MEEPAEVAALRRIPLFDDLTSEDLERLARIGERRSYGSGEAIVEKDTAGAALFIILSGRAAVDVGGKQHELGPGDFVGEMGLLAGKPRSATVIAAEPVEALVIETMYFKPFLMKNPSVAVALLEGVAGRLREVQDRIG